MDGMNECPEAPDRDACHGFGAETVTCYGFALPFAVFLALRSVAFGRNATVEKTSKIEQFWLPRARSSQRCYIRSFCPCSSRDQAGRDGPGQASRRGRWMPPGTGGPAVPSGSSWVRLPGRRRLACRAGLPGSGLAGLAGLAEPLVLVGFTGLVGFAGFAGFAGLAGLLTPPPSVKKYGDKK